MDLFKNGNYTAKEGVDLKILYEEATKERMVQVNGITFSVHDDKSYYSL